MNCTHISDFLNLVPKNFKIHGRAVLINFILITSCQADGIVATLKSIPPAYLEVIFLENMALSAKSFYSLGGVPSTRENGQRRCLNDSNLVKSLASLWSNFWGYLITRNRSKESLLIKPFVNGSCTSNLKAGRPEGWVVEESRFIIDFKKFYWRRRFI